MTEVYRGCRDFRKKLKWTWHFRHERQQVIDVDLENPRHVRLYRRPPREYRGGADPCVEAYGTAVSRHMISYCLRMNTVAKSPDAETTSGDLTLSVLLYGG